MNKIREMRIFLKVLFLVVVFVSCSKHQDFVVINKSFDNEEWERFEYLNGKIEIADAASKYDIVMEVVVSDTYPSYYENHQKDGDLPFNMTIINPDNSGSRSRDYNFKLKDKEGNWKSDKRNGYYTFRLPVISEMTFSDDGVYEVKIENKYHRDPLAGIKSLKIECVSLT